jgi:hypothetical protein
MMLSRAVDQTSFNASAGISVVAMCTRTGYTVFSWVIVLTEDD